MRARLSVLLASQSCLAARRRVAIAPDFTASPMPGEITRGLESRRCVPWPVSRDVIAVVDSAAVTLRYNLPKASASAALQTPSTPSSDQQILSDTLNDAVKFQPNTGVART